MSKGKDTSDVVVLEQDLLNLPECFIYRIPPMRSAEGHRAEDWNLPSPLATCALKTIRRDNSLLVKLLASRPKKNGPPGSTEQYLFAQSTVTFSMKNENNNNHEIHTIFSQHLDHSITNVVDSSRYFVIRIQNEKTKREASVGVGFRERDDATNFKMACIEFVKIMAREYKALHNITEHPFDSIEDGNGDSTLPASLNTKLSLKEGEKIHVSIPIKSGSKEIKDEIDIQHQHKHKQSDYKKKNKALIGKGGLFLKKPPPPPSPVKAGDETNAGEDKKEEKNDSDVKEEKEAHTASNEDDDTPSSSTRENEKAVDDDKDNGESNQDISQNDDDDDDEWGDFESG